MRFAHGEGLARQHAVEYNAAEQVVLGDVRQDEAEVALLFGERDDNVRAVDKVDLDVLVLGEEGVQAGLDGRDRDGPLRVLDNEHAVLLCGDERIEVCALGLRRVVRNICLAALCLIERGERLQQLLAVYAEQCAVDRLDDDALVVDVDDLRERKASRMVLLLFG